MEGIMDKIEDENFIINLFDAAKTHDEFLTIMRFGRHQLLQNQPLLAEILVRYAHRRAEEDGRDSVQGSDFIASLLKELGLKIVAIGPNE
jgi:hypothetical protein